MDLKTIIEVRIQLVMMVGLIGIGNIPASMLSRKKPWIQHLNYLIDELTLLKMDKKAELERDAKAL